jgi:hypothetical protein
MNIFRAGVSGLVLLAMLMQLALSEEWPDCKFQCQANDVTVSRLWLGDDRGNDIAPGVTGEKRSCNLWAQFKNNANSPRYAAIMLADLFLNGTLNQSFYDQGLCVLDVIDPKSTISRPVYHLIWTEGEDVMLNRLVLSWETAKGASCTEGNRKCSSRNTKCYGGKEIGYFVETSLSVGFTFDLQGSTPEMASFFARIAGGLGPYVIDWDFGDGSHSKETNPVHIYKVPGNYTVRLQICDQSKKMASVSKEMRVLPCPCTIIGQDHTCLGKTETYNAALTNKAALASNSSRIYRWKLDGIDANCTESQGGESIDINWQDFGSGPHDLQVVIFDPESSKEVSNCDMAITVFPEVQAVISMIGLPY